MLGVQRRVERLEGLFQVTDRFPPFVHQISFIDSDGAVAGTMVISSDPKRSEPYRAMPGYEHKE